MPKSSKVVIEVSYRTRGELVSLLDAYSDSIYNGKDIVAVIDLDDEHTSLVATEVDKE